jgi:hypothetical protein
MAESDQLERIRFDFANLKMGVGRCTRRYGD